MNKPFTDLAGAASDRTGVGPALLVAGMHRSGSSALARVISLLGAELPRTLMRPSQDNPKGYWESDAVAALNDELLAEVGAAWDDPLVFLSRREELSNKPNVLSRIGRVVGAEYELHGPTAIKDPRIALVLDAWLAAAARERLAPRVIVPFRDPLEVAASLNARNGFSYGRSLLLWLSYNLAAEKSSRGGPRVFIHYAELLADWRSALHRLEQQLDARLPAWTPAAEIEVDAFLSRADQHHVSPPGLLRARADVVNWVKQVYEWMLAAAAGEAPDTSVLDAIATEFAASTRVFAPVIAEQATALAAARAAAAKVLEEKAAAEQALERLQREKRELEARRDVLASDVEINRTRADALEQEIEALRARAGQLEAEIAEREARLAETRAALDVSESAAKQESALALQWQAEATTLRREVARLRVKNARQAAHIEGLEASARAAIDRADNEAGKRQALEALATAYRDFIERSVPLGRRLRGVLWRRPLLRPFSLVAEFAILAAKRGPVVAAQSILAAARLRRCGEFDEDYYLERAWDVRAVGQDPVVHYVAAGASEGRDPSPRFSTTAYCRRYGDVARAGANPLLHYVKHGRSEGRAAFAVSADGTPRSPHASDGIDPYAIRPDEVIAQEAKRGGAYMRRFRLLAADPDWAGAVAALNAVSGPLPATPAVSVIVPVHGQLAYTLNCLDALLSHRSRHAFEVIIVDDRSPDASREWLSRVRGIRLHPRDTNGGFIAACNDGARQARGQWLVFLNNDTRVVAGWLDALIDSFASLADAELVGSKLFYPDGSLQEAGCIIWRDGSAWNFGRNDDPGKPEFCYARPVDYVSGASIAISRAVWEEIGGFDPRYAPAYAEDSDLALKVRHVRGKQVWMQPMSRVIHYEGKTSGIDTARGVKAYQVRNAKTLYRTWSHALAGHRENGDSPLLEKDRGVAKRALVLDAATPEPDKDAGSLTCIELMRVLQQAGYKVTFAPANLLYLPTATARLQRDGIEALYYPYTPNLEEFLRKHGGAFDLALMFRLDIAEKWSASVRCHCPHARMIFHCSDLHFVREQRQAELRGDAAAAAIAEQTKARELAVIGAVDATIVHSSYEQDLLAQAAPSARVYVFPWILEPAGRTTPFHLRQDVAFLGGYRHAPNVDAVLHFTRSVWPLIRERRPDMKFIIAGSECPEELRALHGRENVEVVGFVEDLAEFFGKVRLSVAPIRYGAGIKGKVAMSLAHGVPVVLTPCAAEGMGLRDGEATLMRQDDAAFAEAVLAIYDDEARWMCMSERGLEFVDATYGAAVARRRIKELLALAGAATER